MQLSFVGKFLAFTVVLCLVPCGLSVIITEIYTIETDVSIEGSCTKDQVDTLNTYLTESVTLVNSALQAVNSYASSDLSRKQLAAHFAINPRKNNPSTPATPRFLTDVKTAYQDVLDNLENRVTPGGEKPRLFCGSSWVVRKQPSDQAQDANGALVTTDGTANGAPKAIQDVDVYKSQLGKGIFPYWSSFLKLYDFGPAYPNSGTFCDTAKNLGYTSLLPPKLVTVLTICPQAFTISDYTATLGEKVPNTNTALQDCSSRGLTLLHEAFHVNQGGHFLSGSAETYGSSPCLSLVLSRQGPAARTNPDSYVYFALAAYYSQQTFKDSNDNDVKWQFQNGLAVKQP